MQQAVFRWCHIQSRPAFLQTPPTFYVQKVNNYTPPPFLSLSLSLKAGHAIPSRNPKPGDRTTTESTPGWGSCQEKIQLVPCPHGRFIFGQLLEEA